MQCGNGCPTRDGATMAPRRSTPTIEYCAMRREAYSSSLSRLVSRKRECTLCIVMLSGVDIRGASMCVYAVAAASPVERLFGDPFLDNQMSSV